MNQIIAFAGSNSSKSINHQLVTYAASMIPNSEVIKLTDFNIPLYGIDIEETQGFPKGVKELAAIIDNSKALIISIAEHNGNMTAFFKSILDWLSRFNRKFLDGKKVVLLSTSPGGRGGASALEITKNMLPFFGAELIASCSMGDFYKNFKEGKLIGTSAEAILTSAINKIKQE